MTQAENNTLKVGITSLLWGNPAGDLFEPWLEEVHQLGYTGVSGFSDWGWQLVLMKPAEFKGQLSRAGLELASIIAPLDLNFDRYRHVLDVLNETRSQNLVILGGFGHEDREFDFVSDMVSYISELATPRGVNVTYHNHTDNTGETFSQFCRLTDKITPALRHVMVDVGHATKDFIDVPLDQRATAVLDRYGGSVSIIELKDFSPETALNTVLGKGQVNLRSVAARITDIAYSGWLVVEQNGDAEMRADGRATACARQSRQTVHEMFGV
jgi:inosose dehydratase